MENAILQIAKSDSMNEFVNERLKHRAIPEKRCVRTWALKVPQKSGAASRKSRQFALIPSSWVMCKNHTFI